MGELDKVIAEHRVAFEGDSNYGLVEQCRAKLFRQSIRRLTEVKLANAEPPVKIVASGFC